MPALNKEAQGWGVDQGQRFGSVEAVADRQVVTTTIAAACMHEGIFALQLCTI